MIEEMSADEITSVHGGAWVIGWGVGEALNASLRYIYETARDSTGGLENLGDLNAP